MPKQQQQQKQQSLSPKAPLKVEIPPGLDATMSASIGHGGGATDADIKLGERTAFIPMTSQEKQVLDRLEAGLQSAAGLWSDSQQQRDHDQLLSSALHHWQAPATNSGGVDTSWVWEVGRWNTQFSLPFALELRRLEPEVMAEADQLVANSSCLRNKQIELAKKLATAASNNVNAAGKSGKKAPLSPSGCLEEQLDEEPCLCQIRWGLAPDTEAAKRRQLEKLEYDQRHPMKAQHPQHHHHQRAPSTGHRRPIVKTSHLREQWESAPAIDDAGYASQNCSPKSFGGGGFINELLTSSACSSGGRNWAD